MKIKLSIILIGLGVIGAGVFFFTKPFFNIKYSKPKPSPLPAQIDFYKGVLLSMNAPISEIEQIKQSGTNIVDLIVVAYGSSDGTWSLGSKPSEKKEEWQEIMVKKVEAAHSLGMHAAISVSFSHENMSKNPSIWLERAKPVYQEIGEFAAKNNVHLIFVPGEVEVAVGATCCSGGDLEPTANNELSAKGFAFWSSKISHELKDEIRKNFQGHVAADYITGNWWFEGERFVDTLKPWDMTGFYAIRSGVQLDDPDFDTKTAQTSNHRARVVKEVAKRSGVEKIFFGGPLANAMERIRGENFRFDEEKRRSLYEIFFTQTSELVDGYFISKFPPPLYDPVVMEVAKDWFKKF